MPSTNLTFHVHFSPGPTRRFKTIALRATIFKITAATIVPTTFADPATSLTVTGGGSSTIHLSAKDSSFDPATEHLADRRAITSSSGTATAIASQTSVNVTAATLDL